MTFIANDTLKDFMDIYAQEVVNSREHFDRLHHEMNYLEEKNQELQKTQDEETKRSQDLLSQLNAEKKHSAKLKGIVESLKIELQNIRASHTLLDQTRQDTLNLVDGIYDVITGEGSEKQKNITAHELITTFRKKNN